MEIEAQAHYPAVSTPPGPTGERWTTREVLASVALFDGLSPEILAQLGEVMKPRRLRKGQLLLAQGDPGDHLFVIASGEIKILRSTVHGQEAILDVLREGDYFGELALFDAQPRSADVVASQDSTLLVLHRDDFRALVRRYPEIAFPVLSTLSRRLRRTTDLLEESLFLDLPARLARLLLRLARDYGQKTPAGIRIQRLLTNQELADMLGASRPRISEHINRLRRQGIVAFEQQVFQILRLEALQRLAD